MRQWPGIPRLRLKPWLWPARCLLCGDPANSAHICEPCCLDLPHNHTPCPVCAQPLPTATGTACANCQQQPPPYSRVRAPWIYSLPVDHLLHRFKYHGHLGCGRLLATLLAEHLYSALREQALPGLIMPVPLHPARQRWRGFNQALELARPAAHGLGIKLDPRRLQRRQDTPEQVGLNARARRRNLRGAFNVRGTCPAHVAVIDDVFTTGSTAAEIARVLRRAGARQIEIWCVARVVARRGSAG